MDTTFIRKIYWMIYDNSKITYWNCSISLFDGFSLKRKCVNLILIQDLLFISIFFYFQIVIYFKPVPNGHKKTFYTFLSCGLSSILVKGPSRFLIHELNGILGFEVIFKRLFERPLVCKKKKREKNWQWFISIISCKS